MFLLKKRSTVATNYVILNFKYTLDICLLKTPYSYFAEATTIMLHIINVSIHLFVLSYLIRHCKDLFLSHKSDLMNQTSVWPLRQKECEGEPCRRVQDLSNSTERHDFIWWWVECDWMKWTEFMLCHLSNHLLTFPSAAWIK